MTCIKTGADVYFSENDCIIHGDLHQIGETYILNARGCGTPQYEVEAGDVYHIEVFGYDECGVDLYAWTTDHCFDFNYKGWSHK